MVDRIIAENTPNPNGAGDQRITYGKSSTGHSWKWTPKNGGTLQVNAEPNVTTPATQSVNWVRNLANRGKPSGG